ncbi:oxalate/formate antiporter [Hartmannibacter diazotrophicus]|uniref:Oxalate/formate antiporter n=1 Tax=Hartmannibacter diazotrophicus TaxID=1482074 RepID=A0A2C9D2N8_9HYPH|nr:MFS transporter [Hartmannibacter diazotrophicus]SON54524.1 oxalate/formate antiporter [Hartmannibacter diazotrophicus]
MTGLLPFIRDNLRWLAGGFLLLFCSAFGQTFFVSLSAGEIRKAFQLSNGEFATLFMVATLLSAVILTRLGSIIDTRPVASVVGLVTLALAAGAAILALGNHLVIVFIGLLLLRLFGQGMMVHVAFTTAGRWFSATRGLAISIMTLGFNAGQAITPLAAVVAIEWFGWRALWWAVAALLAFVALPLLVFLLKQPRTPLDTSVHDAVAAPRDWTRKEVLRDPVFYLLLLGMLPPTFISNTVFFHQVYLVDLRGWDLTRFAESFPLLSGVTILCTFLAGQLVDRFTARQLLPFYLIPFGLGLLILGFVEQPWAGPAYFVLYGITDGFSLCLFGALWPEVYGRRHLGAIRAAIVAMMVFSSAAGPGLAGWLIDAGIAYPGVLTTMGLYCLVVTALLMPTVRRVEHRLSDHLSMAST